MSSIPNPFASGLFNVHTHGFVNPAAGANAVIPAPGNQRAKLVCLSFCLADDANVAGRVPTITQTRGALVQRIGAFVANQTQNVTSRYTCLPGVGARAIANWAHAAIGLPDTPMFLEGDALGIDIENIQVGDQISEIVATWHLWIYPQ